MGACSSSAKLYNKCNLSVCQIRVRLERFAESRPDLKLADVNLPACASDADGSH